MVWLRWAVGVPPSCPTRRLASIQVQARVEPARVARPRRGRLEIGDGVGLELGINVAAPAARQAGVGINRLPGREQQGGIAPHQGNFFVRTDEGAWLGLPVVE